MTFRVVAEKWLKIDPNPFSEHGVFPPETSAGRPA